MNKTRVLIVEAHAGFRRILSELLAEEMEIDVVGQTGRASEVPGSILESGPDVVIVDANLAGDSGLAISRMIKQLCPRIHVVVLAEEDNSAYSRAIQASGASASVKKAAVVKELAPCIRRVARGRSMG